MFASETSTLGDLTEQAFSIEVDGRTVPGVRWTPPGDAKGRVLLGHGGTAHKKTEVILAVAQAMGARGFESFAIDGPGHGERPGAVPPTSPDFDFAAAWNSGGGTEGMVADWRAALDFVEAECGELPTGWWGYSMGTMQGLPVTVAEPRIRAAALGLMGTWGPAGKDMRRLAPELTTPVHFAVQWDDEVVPRDRALELFDLIGTPRKTLVANPGIHVAVPRTALESAYAWLDYRLTH